MVTCLQTMFRGSKMQCPSCAKCWPETEDAICPDCKTDMREGYMRRLQLATQLHGHCSCVDKAGDCDFCRVYYAADAELEKIEMDAHGIPPIEKDSANEG